MNLFFLAASKQWRKEEDRKEEKNYQREEGKLANGSDLE